MADAKLRQLRSQVHKLFDPLWREKHFRNRYEAYRWLSKKMKIPATNCHVSYFDKIQCHQATAILESYCSELQEEAMKEQQQAKWKPSKSLFEEKK
jgi:hypothetical protein